MATRVAGAKSVKEFVYEWEGKDRNGKIVRGDTRASGENQVQATLRRQGGCGVCKVQVLEGQFVRRVMSRAHVSAEEESAGCVLSCRIYPSSDLRVNVIGAMKKNVCRPAAASFPPNP